MYLRDLAVFPSQFRPGDEFTAIFNMSAHIVVGPVLAWIQRNKVVLDQLAKLNVEAGEPDPETSEIRYGKRQGVGTYYAPGFDFEGYSQIDDAEQQHVVLNLSPKHSAMLRICPVTDTQLCFDAVRKIRESGLPPAEAELAGIPGGSAGRQEAIQVIPGAHLSLRLAS